MAAVDPRAAYPGSPSTAAPPNPVDLARYAQATIARSISEELDPSDRLIAMSAESKLMQVRSRRFPLYDDPADVQCSRSGDRFP